MASYNLENLRATVAQRLKPGKPEYKTGSRSAPLDIHSPFSETYQHLSQCFQQLEPFLIKGDQAASLAKAQEAINILLPEKQGA